MTTVELLELLWRDYVAVAPQAEEIHTILTGRGEILCNDHVALRTFAVPELGGDALARPFAALGWQPGERYEFLGGVRARAWQHADPALPRVLISELVVDRLSPCARAVIQALVDQLPARFGERDDLAWAGRPWRVTHGDYQALRAESAYAAWVAAFGLLVNHFTIDAGALSTFPDLAAVGAFLIEHGFALDDPGGRVAGSRGERPGAQIEQRIERAATRADPVAVEFIDAIVRIPSCHYEIVRRYRMPSGELFTGFVAASAGGAT